MTRYYDRRVLPSFVGVFEHGCLSKLPELARSDRLIWDVHFRRKAATAMSQGPWSFTIYAGLSAVLTICRTHDRWSATTDEAYKEAATWPSSAGTSQSLESFCRLKSQLIDFVLDATSIAVERRRFIEPEGRVHAAFSSGVDHGRTHIEGLRVVDHEANVGFEPTAADAWWEQVHERLRTGLVANPVDETWWPPKLPQGGGCDFWCTNGPRLFAVEAKPASATAGITAGPLQVRAYAELFADWIAGEPEHVAIIEGMIDQRHRVGFGGPAIEVRSRPLIVPVLLVGDGEVSPEAERRARLVARAADEVRSPGVAPMQWWRVDRSGRVTEWNLA